MCKHEHMQSKSNASVSGSSGNYGKCWITGARRTPHAGPRGTNEYCIFTSKLFKSFFFFLYSKTEQNGTMRLSEKKKVQAT